MTYYDKIAAVSSGIDHNPDYTEEDKAEVKEYLTTVFFKLPDYFTAVIMQCVEMSMMDGHYNPYKVEAIDKTRREKHIAATSAVNIINRIAEKNGLKEKFFAFPEIGDRELNGGTMTDRGQAAVNAKNDRDLAALRIYSFCKQMFLQPKDKVRYNKFEEFSLEEMDKELYQMSEEKTPVTFTHAPYKNLNDLIKRAEQVYGTTSKAKGVKPNHHGMEIGE